MADPHALPDPPALPDLPPRLPWLIYPSTERPSVYCVAGPAYYNVRGLPADVRAARICGSGDGGWLLLAFQHGYAFYNLNTGRRTPLPARIWSPAHNNAEVPLRVVQASFPAARPDSNGPDAVGASAFVDGEPTAAFWCPGRACWFTRGGPRMGLAQDVMHHQGRFYFLMPGEQLIVFAAVPGSDAGQVVLRRWDAFVRWRPDFVADLTRMLHRGGMIMMNYLVRSRGRLLMARRYVDERVGTTLVKLSRLITYTTTTINGDQQENWAWGDNVVLDGQVLFLGPGCSRCFELNGLPELNDAAIYFLDERTTLPEAADTGRFSQKDLEIERWPPAPGHPTPIWWLH